MIDLEKNQKINVRELTSFIATVQTQNVIQLNKKIRKHLLSEDTNIDHIFQSIDRDQNGIIEYHEFYQALHSLKLNLTTFQTIQLFDYFDRAGDEKINYKEFQEMLSCDNIQIERLRENVEVYLQKNGIQLKQFFNILDSDEGGQISRREFKRMMNMVNYQFILGRVQDDEVQELFE